MMLRKVIAVFVLTLALPWLCHARTKTIQHESLANYIARMQQQAVDLTPASRGSLWTDNGRLTNMAADYKAAHVGDLITIAVLQDVQADNSGSVASDRSFKASSGIDALAGHISTSGVQAMFSPRSSVTLQGKAQASSKSSLRTSLAGRVVAVLSNGTLVVEAEREITMNNERQTLLLRGLVRPGDISPGNVVASNVIGDLEFELKGKGVISEGTRPPNAIVRLLLRIVGF
jgi:flagellar L-ring protein precursor FlgH